MTLSPGSIPDVEYAGKVRGTDPDTSWEAAGQMSRAQEVVVLDAIPLLLAEHGPLTHEQLHEKYRENGGTRSENRIRTATAQLVREGRVKALPELGTTRSGNAATRWTVAS